MATSTNKKKIQKNSGAIKRGDAKKKAPAAGYNRCEKATATSCKVTITEFELFYDNPRSDEDIIGSIREAYLEARNA